MVVLLIVLVNGKGRRFLNPTVKLSELGVFIGSLEKGLNCDFSHTLVLLGVDREEVTRW